MSRPFNPKEYKVKIDKNIAKHMNEQYGFSHTDNDVKKTNISPDKFIHTTYKEADLRCKRDNEYQKKEGRETKRCNTPREYRKKILLDYKIKGIKNVFQGKEKSKYGIPIPFLEFDSCKRPVGHEGRHTMVALKSLGIKKAPVTLVHKQIRYNWERPCK